MTRDEIIRMAREADCMHVNLYGDQAMAIERLTRFAALVAAAEREACAKICDEQYMRARTSPDAVRANACAERIRARGEKGQS